MSRTADEKIHQLFSPLKAPEKISEQAKSLLVIIAEQVYPERDELTISHEEKMRRMLGVFYYKKALGKKIFKELQDALKAKMVVKQEMEAALRALPAPK